MQHDTFIHSCLQLYCILFVRFRQENVAEVEDFRISDIHTGLVCVSFGASCYNFGVKGLRTGVNLGNVTYSLAMDAVGVCGISYFDWERVFVVTQSFWIESDAILPLFTRLQDPS